AGKIRYIGASNVTLEQLATFRKMTPVVSVQGEFNVLKRPTEDVLKVCERDGLVFLPWFPLGNGEVLKPGGPLEPISKITGIPPAQLALAWLLRRSKSILLFPGTAFVKELEQNFGAARVELSPDVFASLN